MVDDALWSAVGDPTRRRMLDLLLAEGGGTATSLSARLPVTRQAVARHLVVLDRAGLVHGVTAGREKQYRVDSAQLARAVAQLADVGATWDRRLQRIKEIAEAIGEKARKQAREQGQGQEQVEKRTAGRDINDDRHPAPHLRRGVDAGEGLRRAHHTAPSGARS